MDRTVGAAGVRSVSGLGATVTLSLLFVDYVVSSVPFGGGPSGHTGMTGKPSVKQLGHGMSGRYRNEAVVVKKD